MRWWNRVTTSRVITGTKLAPTERPDLTALTATPPFCPFCADKLELVRRMGATHTINSREVDVAEAVAEITGGRGVDVAFEALGSAATTRQAVEITQADLARYVFVSRQVVNHYLGEWQDRGWVSTSRRRVTVTDRQALAAIAVNGGCG